MVGMADGDQGQVSLGVVRRLGEVSARIYAASDLGETLQAVADGIVEGLGFGVAAVNFRRDDGDYEVVAVAGDADAHATLHGSVVAGAQMQQVLAAMERWGRLRYLSHRAASAVQIELSWVPDLPGDVADGMWHPEDLLVVPLGDDDDEPVAVVSVDLPPGGRLPSPQLQELVEVFALQAGVAVTVAALQDQRRALLEHWAQHDELTGLANRRGARELLIAAIDGAAAGSPAGALFMIDVDGLKPINDRHGHQAGDLALQAAARGLRALVGADGAAARIGGDEFLVVATVDHDRAVALERDIAGLVIDVPGTTDALSVSVGMVPITDTTDVDRLMAGADERMYVAKQQRGLASGRGGA